MRQTTGTRKSPGEKIVKDIKRAQAEGKYKGRVPTAMKQADKVKALVDAGVAGTAWDQQSQLLPLFEGKLTEAT